MASFPAKYRGRCAAGDEIQVGEDVRYLDEDQMHVNCANDVERQEAQAAQWTGTTDEEMGY